MLQEEAPFLGTSQLHGISIFKNFLQSEDPYVRLYYTKYYGSNPSKSLLITHGFGQHSGRFEEVALEFASKGFEVHTIDLRGFGYSGAARASSTIEQLQNDMLRTLCEVNVSLPLFLYGHSMGGMLVIKLLLERPEINVSGCIITSPLLGFPPERPLPWIKVTMLRLMGDSLQDIIINSMVNPTSLTKNNQIIKKIMTDRLSIPFLSMKMAKSIFDSIAFVRANQDAFSVPACVFHGKKDSITNWEDSRNFVFNKPSPLKKLHLFENGFHQLQHDEERKEMLTLAINFLQSLPADKVKPLGINRFKLVPPRKEGASRLKYLVILVVILFLLRNKLKKLPALRWLLGGGK